MIGATVQPPPTRAAAEAAASSSRIPWQKQTNQQTNECPTTNSMIHQVWWAYLHWGLVSWAERCRTELAAAGGLYSPHPTDPTGHRYAVDVIVKQPQATFTPFFPFILGRRPVAGLSAADISSTLSDSKEEKALIGEMCHCRIAATSHLNKRTLFHSCFYLLLLRGPRNCICILG